MNVVCCFAAVILFSACLAVVPLALHVRNKSFWFHLALVVLVSACPCALILSTPVVTYCALTKAAGSGLLIKGGNVLEILAKIKVAAFDKTGTITRGEFVVSHFQSLGEKIDFNTLLFWYASQNYHSSSFCFISVCIVLIGKFYVGCRALRANQAIQWQLHLLRMQRCVPLIRILKVWRTIRIFQEKEFMVKLQGKVYTLVTEKSRIELVVKQV